MWLTLHHPGIPFEVEQFCPQWADIPDEEQCALGGEHCRLASAGGEFGAPIGTQMLDRETKFRIVIGPVQWDHFLEFLPDRHLWQEVTRLTEDFAPDWLSFDIRLILDRRACRNLAVCLDGDSSQLGLNTGLYADEDAEDHLRLLFETEPYLRQKDEDRSMGVLAC